MEPKIRKAEVVESEASPPYDELQEGIYVLVNKATRTVLYLDGGTCLASSQSPLD